MSAAITDNELGAIRASTREHLDELLEEPEIASDVVGLERVGVALLAAFDAPQAPPELGKVLVDALADRGCEASVGVLAVLAAFGRKTIAHDALKAACVLPGRDAGAVGDVGALKVREVWHSAIPSGEAWVAILNRPGREAPQAACLTLETGGEGPIAVDALLTGTGPANELDAALALLAEGAERSTEQALAERLRTMIENMNEAQLAAPLEVGICVPILARAISGEAAALGHVTTYSEMEDEELDDEPFPEEDAVEEALLDELVRDYGRYVCDEHGPNSAVWHHGEFVSCALLDWKRDYHDGHPTRWTVAHVEEFMLDFAPRKMTMDDEAIQAVADCLAAFMGFLDRADKLEGDGVDALMETCERLCRKSVAACRDPSHWGMSKSIAMQMIADGVDPTDPMAGEAWIAAYNMRLAAARNDPRQHTQPFSRRAASAGRSKRTAAKQARRRNRR
jgi:hypothetical protein